jgi:hypothetical protein
MSKLIEKKARQVKGKVESMLILFFDTNNSSWQAKQSIPHTTVTFHGNCVKICEDSAPNYGDKRTGCFITTTQYHTPFSPGNFDHKQHDCHPPPTLLFSVSLSKDKTVRPPF